MADNDYEPRYIKGINYSKRCGVQHVPWMGDWFVSHSPRNWNSNAEGPWDHWVALALSILQHPATALVRPEAFEAVAELPAPEFHDETGRALADHEIKILFGGDDE